MGIPDLITQFSRAAQVITSSDVGDHVISFPSDAARYAFIHSENLIRMIVAVAAAGLASGMRLEFRFDTQADLNSGSQIVAGATRVLTAGMLTVRSVHYLRVNPVALPEGYDFAGVYYNVIGAVGSGGFAVRTALVDGAERIDEIEP